MKKPLQRGKPEFILRTKGQLIGWGEKDAKNLVKNANRAIRENLMDKYLLNQFEYECTLAFDWFSWICDRGIDKELFRQLNGYVGQVSFIHVLREAEDGSTQWRIIANGDLIPDPSIAIAYAVSHLLQAGELIGLGRCKLKSCNQFFIGRPNTKWCSKSCGSKHRVTKKRMLEKQYSL